MGRVLIHQLVLRLRGAYFVVVYLMVFIGVGEFLAGLGAGIGAVEEAVAMPVGACEFGPLYMVVEQFFRLGVHDEDFSPV